MRHASAISAVCTLAYAQNFQPTCLGFRVDQMTLTSRKEMMERQKKLADINMERELDCFHNMLNVSGSAALRDKTVLIKSFDVKIVPAVDGGLAGR